MTATMLATMAVALVLAPASAAEGKRPAGPAELVMGGDPAYRPFHYLDERGRAAGFDVELIKAVLGQRRVKFEFGPWGAVLERLERGEIDVVPMFVSPERAERFLFSKPYLLRYHMVFGRSDAAAVESLEALAGHRVAVQHAGMAWEALRGPDAPAVQLVEVEMEAAALAVVSRGEADYAVVPTGIGYDATAEPALADVVALSPPLLERSYAFAIRPGHPELLALVNAGLDRARLSGEQDRLYAQWIGNVRANDDDRPAMPLLLWIGVPLLLLAPALLWWRRAPRRPAHAEPVSTGATPVDVDDARRKPGVADRQSLIDRLDRRIGQWQPGSAGFALAEMHLLGLDLLENIADEASSQHVQQAVAQRLAAEFGTEHLAVLGPGSFAVILEVAGDRSAAEAMVPQLSALLARRIEVDALPVELRSRIGIALFPTDATGAPELVRAARIACGAAHKQMVAGVCYEPGLQPDRRDLTLLAELREAIRSGQLGYALQPKLDLKLRRWVGAELLVRWNHPQHGPLAPYAFVPQAEQAGVIGEMTLYLIQRGLAHCRRWQQLGHSLSLSVNVSANDLADLTLVAAIIEGSGELGARLMLEVTETDIMRNPERIAEAVLQLRQHGIRISLDDFGTGHSSLTNLRRLDPDELKIDRSFVQALRHSPSDQAIVRATIRLAHELGASVTAEGIEDEATLQWLTEAGCNAAQGFALARPMTPAQFAELLQAQRG